ncbi:MAG: protein translocase subunit SecD, partial [Spirochaetes bacterium]|nr:protein translocase subunit SecD [Spirochaetota bacterium]
MSKRGRLIVVLLVLAVSGYFLYPTISWYAFVPQETKELATGSKEQIKEYARGQAAQDLRELKNLVKSNPEEMLPSKFSFIKGIAKDNYKASDRAVPASWTIANVMNGFANEQKFFDTLEQYYRSDLLDMKDFRGKALQLGLDLSGGMSILLEADKAGYEAKLERSVSEAEVALAVQQDLEILNNRIDQFGLTEPELRLQGTSQILVEIPGAADPERVNSFLKGKGSLAFHIVDEELTTQLTAHYESNPAEKYNNDGSLRTPEFIPPGRIVVGVYAPDAYGIDEQVGESVLYEEVGLDGIHIVEALTSTDSITGRPTVNFQLDVSGGEIFYKLTSTNTNKRLAVVMDKKIKAQATISEAIRSSVRMSGFSSDQASDLAIVLKTAALPIALDVANQQAIGASLGEDSVRQGIYAIAVGFFLVIIFMLLYYRRAGLVADGVLILNLIIITAVLSAFNLTLTLTSIAGIILTVGMAVDANVIIYERIKEEYRLGKSAGASVKAGFNKAFWTIMDANITTFIAALVLAQLGTGGVKGFANTLAVGIITSMFTALFVSRLVFDFFVQKVKINKLR